MRFRVEDNSTFSNTPRRKLFHHARDLSENPLMSTDLPADNRYTFIKIFFRYRTHANSVHTAT
jgi:hypothetical protein